MCKAKTIAVCMLALSCLAIGSTGGFMAGGYLTTERLQKTALAHSCGILDPQTLSFSWTTQPAVGIMMDAMPDIAPVKSKKAVAK